MPSVHVAWAVLVGYYTWRISPSRWRYIGPVHSALMSFIVVATGNHWWLDGIVAVAILSLCAWALIGVRKAWGLALRSWTRSRRTPFAEPAFTLPSNPPALTGSLADSTVAEP
jgi:membrane-associated phospholipid phosphatase